MGFKDIPLLIEALAMDRELSVAIAIKLISGCVHLLHGNADYAESLRLYSILGKLIIVDDDFVANSAEALLLDYRVNKYLNNASIATGDVLNAEFAIINAIHYTALLATIKGPLDSELIMLTDDILYSIGLATNGYDKPFYERLTENNLIIADHLPYIIDYKIKRNQGFEGFERVFEMASDCDRERMLWMLK